jgi:replicative superfamily II helicase
MDKLVNVFKVENEFKRSGDYKEVVGEYPYKMFNPIQSATLSYLDSEDNLVISAPTSSGKTICGEFIGSVNLGRRSKVVYLVPMKAIAEERFQEWSDLKHPWGKVKKAILTGDYDLTPKRQEELNQASVIIMTYEMFSVRVRNSSSESSMWIQNVGVLIVDEAHFLSSDGRGDHLEHGLVGFIGINPDARLVLLSATLINSVEIAEWLSKVTNKKFTVFQSNYRPCQLTMHYLTFRDNVYWAEEEEEKIEQVKNIVEAHKDQWLVFVHAKAIGYRLQKELSDYLGEPVAFHCADRAMEERRKIEHDFKRRVLRVLIATSTLAYGVNLPARRVVVVGTKRGFSDVDALDIIQECGRAGRYGYDKEGDAYLVLKEKEFTKWKMLIENGVYVRSRLSEKVGFHLIGEVAENRVSTISEAEIWYKKMLSYFQNASSKSMIPLMWDQYKQYGLIHELDEVISASTLGTIASKNYFDPFDVVSWKKNLGDLHDFSLLDNDVAFAWMISNVATKAKGYIPTPIKLETNQYLGMCRALNRRFIGHEAVVYATVIYNQMKGMPIKNLPSVTTSIFQDMERVFSCLLQINNRIYSAKNSQIIKDYYLRIKYGVEKHLLSLVRVSGIGPVYAKHLYDHGIRYSSSIIPLKHIAKRILPKYTYDKIIKALTNESRKESKDYIESF